MTTKTHEISARARISSESKRPTENSSWTGFTNVITSDSNFQPTSIPSIEIKPNVSGKEVIINVHIKW